MQLRDLWREDQWKFEGLASVLPNQVKNFLRQHSFTAWGECEASWAWKANESGIYTTSSGYKWLQNLINAPSAGGSWTWIWKLKGSEKCRFFVWQLLHAALPTASFRFHRKLTDSELCPRCMNGVENIGHCLRDCTDSRRLWLAFGFGSIPSFFSMELIPWIIHFLKD